MSCLFGPVPSRRYGRSLGIDLVPMKTCCYDCVFCQLGITPQTTCARRDYLPIESVLSDLKQWLTLHEPVDILTLCGSGEPTLHAHFGDVLRWIRAETPYPSLLMSNGALFFEPEVRRDAALADRVKISMHFWDETSFRATVRPHADLTFEKVYDGWLKFRETFHGTLDIEFFALPGMNDAPEALNRIHRLMSPLRPDTVTVNSAERPPAESSVRSVPVSELNQLRAFFGTVAVAQTATASTAPQPYSEAALLALARRHPLTPAQFARYFGMPESQIVAALQRLATADPYAARALLPHDVSR